MKNIFRKYIQKNKVLITLVAIALGLYYYIPIKLYNIAQETIVYPMLLIFILFVCYFYSDYFKMKKKVQKLEIIKKNTNININEIFKKNNIEEKMYTDIILKLQNDNIKIFNIQKKEIDALNDYYTIWVHQIKTPIAALSFLIENIEDENKKKLEAELFKIEQYVELVLSYIRLESKTNDLVAERINIIDITRNVLKKHAVIFINKKITIDYDSINLKVISDKKWLEFILEQLVSNALKYTKQNGLIKIYTDKNSIYIKDNGIGITADNLPKIFEQGYTGLNGRQDKKSSGIGLYLTKKAVDKLGHKITISSEVNKGTTVKISFEQANIINNMQ